MNFEISLLNQRDLNTQIKENNTLDIEQAMLTALEDAGLDRRELAILKAGGSADLSSLGMEAGTLTTIANNPKASLLFAKAAVEKLGYDFDTIHALISNKGLTAEDVQSVADGSASATLRNLLAQNLPNNLTAEGFENALTAIANPLATLAPPKTRTQASFDTQSASDAIDMPVFDLEMEAGSLQGPAFMQQLARAFATLIALKGDQQAKDQEGLQKKLEEQKEIAMARVEMMTQTTKNEAGKIAVQLEIADRARIASIIGSVAAIIGAVVMGVVSVVTGGSSLAVAGALIGMSVGVLGGAAALADAIRTDGGSLMNDILDGLVGKESANNSPEKNAAIRHARAALKTAFAVLEGLVTALSIVLTLGAGSAGSIASSASKGGLQKLASSFGRQALRSAGKQFAQGIKAAFAQAKTSAKAAFKLGMSLTGSIATVGGMTLSMLQKYNLHEDWGVRAVEQQQAQQQEKFRTQLQQFAQRNAIQGSYEALVANRDLVNNFLIQEHGMSLDAYTEGRSESIEKGGHDFGSFMEGALTEVQSRQALSYLRSTAFSNQTDRETQINRMLNQGSMFARREIASAISRDLNDAMMGLNFVFMGLSIAGGFFDPSGGADDAVADVAGSVTKTATKSGGKAADSVSDVGNAIDDAVGNASDAGSKTAKKVRGKDDEDAPSSLPTSSTKTGSKSKLEQLEENLDADKKAEKTIQNAKKKKVRGNDDAQEPADPETMSLADKLLALTLHPKFMTAMQAMGAIAQSVDSASSAYASFHRAAMNEEVIASTKEHSEIQKHRTMLDSAENTAQDLVQLFQKRLSEISRSQQLMASTIRATYASVDRAYSNVATSRPA